MPGGEKGRGFPVRSAGPWRFMREKKRYRIPSAVRKYSLISAAGFLYLFWLKGTGIGIPCPFHLITGLKCPGCGISTMLVRLASRDLRGSFEANPFLFVTWPFIVWEIIFSEDLRQRSLSDPAWNRALLAAYLAALIVFGVLRNLPFLPF